MKLANNPKSDEHVLNFLLLSNTEHIEPKKPGKRGILSSLFISLFRYYTHPNIGTVLQVSVSLQNDGNFSHFVPVTTQHSMSVFHR